MNMLPNISRSKVNQAMKPGQLIKHNRIFFFFKKKKKKKKSGTPTSPKVFQESLIWDKKSGLQLRFNLFQ